MPIPVSIRSPHEILHKIADFPLLGGLAILLIALLIPMGLGIETARALAYFRILPSGEFVEMLIAGPLIILNYFILSVFAKTNIKVLWLPSWVLGLAFFGLGLSEFLNL